MVGLPDLMEQLLQYLLVWPWFPVVWLDNDATRTMAPLFVVARYGPGKKPHTCFFQFGCRYCRRQTELLYPAADGMARKHADQQLMKFFEPLLRQYMSRRVLPHQPTPQVSLPLTTSSLDLVANRHEVHQPPPPPPPPPTPPLPPSSAAADTKLPPSAVTATPRSDRLHVAASPSSADADDADASVSGAAAAAAVARVNGKWEKYVDPDTKFVWWHNDATHEFFFEATGTSQKPEGANFGKCCSKESKTTPGEEDGTTEACDSCTHATLTDDDSVCAASSDCPPTQAFPAGPPGPGYAGLCTHRTYARNLYREGQLPGFPQEAPRNS